MHRFLVVMLMAFFVMQITTGCGQRQEFKNKAQAAIKPTEPSDKDTEDEADTEEETVSTSNGQAVSAPAAAAPASAVTAPDKGSDPSSNKVLQTLPASSAQAPVAVVEEPAPSETLVLADFDSGEKPNNVGGNFGAWNKDPSDPTQWCKEGFDNVTKHGDKGFSMKLDYSVESPNPAYNGLWMMLPNIDASKYDTVNLWVKGDPAAGHTNVFKIELKNANKQVGRYYVSNVSDQWQKVSIPLAEFKSLIDKSNLTEFVIVFEDRMATKKKGIIYVDDVSLSKK